MEIEFDPAKDVVNRRKHGVSLSLGEVVLSNLVDDELDEDENYGEDRIRAFGFVGVLLYVCIYTMRGAAARIISVRPATKAEERRCLT